MATTIRTASSVLRRALSLSALVCRGSLELSQPRTDADEDYEELLEWATEAGLWDYLESNERDFLYTPLGELNPNEAHQAVWVSEGVAVLAWALDRLELPRLDALVDAHQVAYSVGLFSDDTERQISSATLISLDKVRAYREFIYNIHCRLRIYLRNRVADNFQRWMTDELEIVNLLGIDEMTLFSKHDLAIDGISLSQVNERRVMECERITFERHRAIIWLVEDGGEYLKVRVDT